MDTKIKIIEKIEFLDLYDRAKLVLVYLGLKPACEVSIYKSSEAQKLKNILKEVGLYCLKSKHFNKESYDEMKKVLPSTCVFPISRCSVAKDFSTAKKLSEINPAQHHREYGKLMGYPKTAIDNFLKKESCLNKSSMDKLKKKYGIIFSFRLPKTNYQDELNLLIDWSENIKKYAPELYKKILEY